MSLREGNLSTEIFLIDMSYSPVCSVLVETHKAGTDRNCLGGSCPFLSPRLSICVCVLQIDILFNNLFKQKAESDAVIQSSIVLEQNDFDYYLNNIMQSNIKAV